MKQVKKPTFKEIQELEELKDQARQLLDQVDQQTQKLFRKYGESEAVYEIETDEDGCKFIRLKLVDNVRRLEEDEICFKAASFKKIDAEIKRLKREPKAA